MKTYFLSKPAVLLAVYPGKIAPLVYRYCYFYYNCYVTCVEWHASMYVFDQTHQSQCLVQDERFRSVDCDIFAHNKPPTMALSTLVVIEMLNALNR